MGNQEEPDLRHQVNRVRKLLIIIHLNLGIYVWCFTFWTRLIMHIPLGNISMSRNMQSLCCAEGLVLGNPCNFQRITLFASTWESAGLILSINSSWRTMLQVFLRSFNHPYFEYWFYRMSPKRRHKIQVWGICCFSLECCTSIISFRSASFRILCNDLQLPMYCTFLLMNR